MYYRLSNIASRKVIEKTMDAEFSFPKLYEPQVFIDGLCEASLPIITMERPRVLDYAIWGLLPENYEDSWEEFQQVTNTLNVNWEQIFNPDDFFSKTSNNRRCLIVVTGIYMSLINHGKLMSYHVHLPDNQPFCLGGIYTRLNDGFLTCSLILTKLKKSFKNISPLSSIKPLILDKHYWKIWMNPDSTETEIKSMVASHRIPQLLGSPVTVNYNDDEYLLHIADS